MAMLISILETKITNSPHIITVFVRENTSINRINILFLRI